MNRVCIITALPAESRVFIDKLKLRRIELPGLHVYQGERHLLLQTGIGKLPATAASAALLQARTDVIGVINTGIAGGTADIGSVHLAHSIHDVASARRWYPHLPPRRSLPNLQGAELDTLDTPSADYRDGVLFDMEGAGVASAAGLFLSTDAMQCIKVISDNPEHHWQGVIPAQVSELMQAALPGVQQLSDHWLNAYADTAGTQALSDCLAAITARVHHSTNDRHQLQRLLQRQQVLTGTLPSPETMADLRTARAVRYHLQQRLQATPLHYGD